ncbi:hypothetical protein KKQ11_26065 [Pseudomonas sp. MG-2]|jgi:hypothetical protein|uniref:hypothetical protein n=1 Tax=Pseudomonas TaxID=286 RepID=UPI001C008C04|nr:MULTISPECIES: hypothetical protein [Pseudomonas]MBT9239293.1 hypothetical protein [Pseudomonas sp. MG-2]MCE1010095.1 hypothetical protein [Pseudomonas monteilii]MCE1056012.1 hypothetical protein [Pseudomonas alloputida]
MKNIVIQILIATVASVLSSMILMALQGPVKQIEVPQRMLMVSSPSTRIAHESQWRG